MSDNVCVVCIKPSFKKNWQIFDHSIGNVNHFFMTENDIMMTSNTQETLNDAESRIVSQLTLCLAIYFGSVVLSFFYLIFKNPRTQDFSSTLTGKLITSFFAPLVITYAIIKHIFKLIKKIIKKSFTFLLQDIIFPLIINLFLYILIPIFDIFYLIYCKTHIIWDFFWEILSKICTIFVRRVIWPILRFIFRVIDLIFAITDWIHNKILRPLYFVISNTLGKIFRLIAHQSAFLIVLKYISAFYYFVYEKMRVIVRPIQEIVITMVSACNEVMKSIFFNYINPIIYLINRLIPVFKQKKAN
ncbi:hypothetical protein TRFO_31150 [Tritrichomonas foetus]|uniref:Uncharacterized protein n=1 Tax=Tritrichomonas foetus TaxID=1144522 RepID=A0A1J4JTX1_9EUKA|nr:hypothetical protein TRFO_31150 [Tritrichomonas foetus]|eukprot:OHT01912.1 hypothetical protein TRFO_31150 [Tritrichomonas foetus]